MPQATIERRVAALEASVGGGRKCPECGFGRDEKPPRRVRIVSPGEPREPDTWCGECGRQLIHNVSLRWDDIPGRGLGGRND